MVGKFRPLEPRSTEHCAMLADQSSDALHVHGVGTVSALFRKFLFEVRSIKLQNPVQFC